MTIAQSSARPSRALTYPSFEIVFDGGALGNPGKGYGSYEITRSGRVICRRREDYGDQITNNQAEYMTLIRAFQWLANELGPAAPTAKVLVNGDSKLVLFQLLKKWKLRNEGLRPLYVEASALMGEFFKVDLVWHPRAKSVERLGH